MKRALFVALLALIGTLAHAQSSMTMEGSVTSHKEFPVGIEYQHFLGESPFSLAARGSVFTAKRWNDSHTIYDHTTHALAGGRLYFTATTDDGQFFLSPGAGLDYHYANTPSGDISYVDPATTLKAGTYYGKDNQGILYLFGNAVFSRHINIFSLGIGFGGIFSKTETGCKNYW